jgi:hypothetical protein
VYSAIDHTKAKATKIAERKIEFHDGSILEINIWQLPTLTAERPHGFKYRLQYCLPNATTLVRYDNKVGKGDHKHISSTRVIDTRLTK